MGKGHNEKSQIEFQKEILRLYNAASLSFNIETKIIGFFSVGDAIIGTDLTITEFATEFANVYDLDDSQIFKLEKFFTNFELAEGQNITMDVSFDMKTSKRKIRMKCIGTLTNGNLFISFRNENIVIANNRDPLTKAYSKKGIMPHIKKAIKEEKEFVLLILDIDDFYTIIEKCGHVYSDVILIEAYSSILKTVGKNGYVARIGLDRFLILYYVKDNYDDIHAACENIRQSVINLNNHNVKQIPINATIGCTSYPSNGQDFDTLYKKTYLALQRGVRKGGACFIIYTPERCGLIEDIIEENIQRFESNVESIDTISAYFNIFAGVFEILNRNSSLKKNYDDALSLIGNFYSVDRISLVIFDSEGKNKELISYIGEQSPIKEQIVLHEDSRSRIMDAFREKDIIKINQIKSNPDSLIYDLLTKEKVTATLIFKLAYGNKVFGLLKFDMLESNRFWSDNDVSSLYIMSQMFSSLIYRESIKAETNQLINYDNLSKLYNYSKWRELIDEKLDAAKNKNERQNFTIIYFYFESFMHLNDSLGTFLCDEAIKHLGQVLKDLEKKYEKEFTILPARVSGDKFIIYASIRDEDIINKIINEIQNNLHESFSYGSQFNLLFGVYINMTSGTFAINNSNYISSAIDKANLARKKANSVSKVCYFTNELYETLAFRAELELHMREALENGEYLLYLQPKVNSETNEVVAAEALTRWNYKFERILAPFYFIPLFEENGFITDFDINCFRNTCKFQRNLLDKGYKPVPISINLSMYQKDFKEYRNKINIIRKEYNLPANLFEIEVTETMFINDQNQVIELLKELHEDGYSVSMDDFGSGYSNLVSLAKFNFDTLKIDKSFIDNSKGIKEKTILKFVTNLAKELNINVLCEGVETLENVNFLRSIGCKLIQGYYYDKPIPCEEFEEKYISKDESQYKVIEGK